MMNLTQERIAEIEALAAKQRQGNRDLSFSMSEGYFHINRSCKTQSSWDEQQFFNEGLFKEILKILNKQGFQMKADPRILEEFRNISKYHKKGRLGDVWCKGEYFPAGMRFEFYPNYATGNKHGPEYSFDRFKQFKYLDLKRVILAQNKIAKYLTSLGFENTSKDSFTFAREEAEYRMRSCSHYRPYDTNQGLHPYLLEGYGSQYNRVDADKKPITNGDVKYFFDYHGKLRRGHVYYNLNSQWYVVASPTEIQNVSSRDLFDYDPQRVAKEFMNDRKISKLRRHLDQAIQQYNFERAAILRNKLWALDGGIPAEEAFVIQSAHSKGENILWWRGGSEGYTENLSLAGRYPKTQAEAIIKRLSGRGDKMWKLSDAEKEFQTKTA